VAEQSVEIELILEEYRNEYAALLAEHLKMRAFMKQLLRDREVENVTRP
jgi:hypothetical protein